MKKVAYEIITKILKILIPTVSGVLFSFTSTPKVNFHEWEWNTLKRAGATYHKPIVFLIYSSRCNESKRIFIEFNTVRTSAFYNRNFICNKMDANEMMQGIKAQKMGVIHVPTIMYFSADCKLVYAIEGFRDRSELISVGQLVKKKINDAKAKVRLAVKAKKQ